MNINDRIQISRRRDNTMRFVIDGRDYTGYESINSDLQQIYPILLRIKNIEDREYEFKKMLASKPQTELRNMVVLSGVYSEEELKNLIVVNVNTSIDEQIREGVSNIIKFFSEFQFVPSFRFVNSLVNNVIKSKQNAVDYIQNYFRLFDSPYANEIVDKVGSPEFKTILECLEKATPTQVINDRLKVYFGPAGTGKTTNAMKETNNLCVVCNSSMLPADLMEDFTFDDGKAAFHPSALARCMQEGKPIVLDEINLLPFDSLRFLQGVFDGKPEFQYKGETIKINSGFKVIGTMNLTVNGVSFALPEPLVDRCQEIKEFKLTADDLMRAL